MRDGAEIGQLLKQWIHYLYFNQFRRKLAQNWNLKSLKDWLRLDRLTNFDLKGVKRSVLNSIMIFTKKFCFQNIDLIWMVGCRKFGCLIDVKYFGPILVNHAVGMEIYTSFLIDLGFCRLSIELRELGWDSNRYNGRALVSGWFVRAKAHLRYFKHSAKFDKIHAHLFECYL